MHYVYILYSPDFDKYYVGESSNVAQRLCYHNYLSTSSWSRSYRPWTLAQVITVTNYGQARKIERFIKKQKRKKFTARLRSDVNLVKEIIRSVG